MAKFQWKLTVDTRTRAKATRASRKANPKAKAGGVLVAMDFKPEDVDAAKVAEPIKAKAKENRKERTRANPRTTARKVVARKVDSTHSNVDFVMNTDIGREIAQIVEARRIYRIPLSAM